MNILILYKAEQSINLDFYKQEIKSKGHLVSDIAIESLKATYELLTDQLRYLYSYDSILTISDIDSDWMRFLKSNARKVYKDIVSIPDLKEEEFVVLSDLEGNDIGSMSKTDAHVMGVLHKAISVMLFNDEGKILVQQRGLTKYHWAGVWSNAVCSHPRKNESPKDAAKRRVYEELGIQTELEFSFEFIYKAYDLSSGLTEFEYDYVFLGKYNGYFNLNKYEVNDIVWMDINQINKDIEVNPDKYSFWFKIILNELRARELV